MFSSLRLTGDELFGVEELSVGSGAYLVDYGGLQIDEDRPGHVLASTSFGEKGVEGVITPSDGLIGRHLNRKVRILADYLI